MLVILQAVDSSAHEACRRGQLQHRHSSRQAETSRPSAAGVNPQNALRAERASLRASQRAFGRSHVEKPMARRGWCLSYHSEARQPQRSINESADMTTNLVPSDPRDMRVPENDHRQQRCFRRRWDEFRFKRRSQVLWNLKFKVCMGSIGCRGDESRNYPSRIGASSGETTYMRERSTNVSR